MKARQTSKLLYDVELSVPRARARMLRGRLLSGEYATIKTSRLTSIPNLQYRISIAFICHLQALQLSPDSIPLLVPEFHVQSTSRTLLFAVACCRGASMLFHMDLFCCTTTLPPPLGTTSSHIPRPSRPRILFSTVKVVGGPYCCVG